jgi:initiation factor 1A
MVKNKFGGNKAKSVARKNATHSKKDLIIREINENEEYVKVIKMLGDRRLLGIMPDKKQILAHIPNRIRKRIFPGDIILVVPQIEGADSKKYSVIYAYENEQIKELIKLEELDKTFAKTDQVYIFNDNDNDDNNIDNFDFDNIDTDDNTDKIDKIDKKDEDEEESINLDDI